MANNGAVADPDFQPSMRVITAITNANPAGITTSFDHDFFVTDIVRIIIPRGFGMAQINNRVVQIVEITSPTTFTIAIDTSDFDVFNDPGNNQFAQVIAIAEDNDTLYGATRNTLPSLNR